MPAVLFAKLLKLFCTQHELPRPASLLTGFLHLCQQNGINAVSPGVVEDSFAEYGAESPGFNPVAMGKVVNAYLKSVESVISGQNIKVYE